MRTEEQKKQEDVNHQQDQDNAKRDQELQERARKEREKPDVSELESGSDGGAASDGGGA